MIYTKIGDKVTEVWIDDACYYGGKLIQIHATVEGISSLRYISDLKGDGQREVKDIVDAAEKHRGQKIQPATQDGSPTQQ